MSNQAASFQQTGRLWLRGAISPDEISSLCSLSELGRRPGARITPQDVLTDAVKNLAFTQQLKDLWPGMRPVRLVAFDKSGTTNWGVPWHQDRVIAVKDRADVPGFGNWSRKGGTWHCTPPLAQLTKMLFVRLHLDACDDDSGPMEIAVGSHDQGIVPAEYANAVAQQHQIERTTCQAGDVLVLSMLTLHRSQPSTSTNKRRVLRVDYASTNLPAPLVWAM